MQASALTLTEYLAECRSLVLAEIQQIIPNNRYRSILYDLMLEYPLRLGKAFRPSLCIATCRALGGRLQDVLRTSAVLELYHNAFLIHDDIEDDSLMRRGYPTLHRMYGTAIAVNVGDGMNALCLQPLLENMQLIGMGKALRIMQIIARMALESVEGQAMELDWIRRGQWQLRDQDYVLMSYKKTCWYTFIAPMQIGAVITGVQPSQLALINRFATYIGVAFQIQDDVLNLIADEQLYGKEINGDLWEGKRTLMLLHMMRHATPHEQETARAILEKPRNEKNADEIGYLYHLIHTYGSIGHAHKLAQQLASKAERILSQGYTWMPSSVHRDFLLGMTSYAINRDK